MNKQQAKSFCFFFEFQNLKVLSSTWLANNISVPSTPLVTGRVLQQGTNNWKLLQVRLLVKKIYVSGNVRLDCFQEEFSLALTEMRTADPGDVILTLRNPKVEGSSLAKRRKTKAELEPVGERSGEDEKVAVKVVSKDSGVDIKGAALVNHDLGGEERKMGTKEDNLLKVETEEIISSREEVFKKGEKAVSQDISTGWEEKKRGEKASSQDSIESHASSDSGQDIA